MLAHKVAQHYGLKTATVPCRVEGRASSSLQVVAAPVAAEATQGCDLQQARLVDR